MNQHAQTNGRQRRQMRQLLAGTALSASLFVGGAGLASASTVQPIQPNLGTWAPICTGEYDPPDCRPLKPEEPGPKGGKLKKRPPSGGGITPDDPGPRNPPRTTPDRPDNDPPVAPPVTDTPRTITATPGGPNPFVAQHQAIPVVESDGWVATTLAAPVAAAPVAAAPAVAALPDTGSGTGEQDAALIAALAALAGAGAAAGLAMTSRARRPGMAETR